MRRGAFVLWAGLQNDQFLTKAAIDGTMMASPIRRRGNGLD